MIAAQPEPLIAFRANQMAVRDALARARTVWNLSGLASEMCDTAEQVLAEVLNNVVQHAHADDPDGQIELETLRAGDGVICVIHDDGTPMPDLTTPEGTLKDMGDNPEHYPESGFGWFLIKRLTQDLAYQRKDGWNLLSFRISCVE